MNYSIEYLINAFSKLQWEDKKYKKPLTMVRKIETLIKGEEVKNIYPKNMFSNNEEIEFYTFTNEHLYITKTSDEGENYLSTTFIKLNDIKSIEKVEGNEYDPVALNIIFYDDKRIRFASNLDTNEHHEYKFREVINELVNFLIERAK